MRTFKTLVDSLGRVCVDCNEYKTWNEYNLNSAAKTGHRTICRKCQIPKECVRIRLARANPNTRAAIIARDSEKRRKNREKLAGVPKTNTCAICKINCESVYDHDHKTGIFRGWLCSSCNKALGFFKDSVHNLQEAIDYIQPVSIYGIEGC